MYNRKRNIFTTGCILIVYVIVFLSFMVSIQAEVAARSLENKIDETSLNKEVEGNVRAGIIKEMYSYSNQSSLGDASDNDVIVTDSQQVFEEPQLYYELTSEEEYMLAKLVACEAGNQSIETKEAVVMVVLNRVNSDKFPNTIEEVIKENHNGVYQFSPVMPDGSFWYKEPTEESWLAVDNVICNMSDMMDCEALYFEALPSAEGGWHQNNLDFLFQSDDTRFYK